MPKPKIDQAREQRITNEIVVDCYNESERFAGWCCYLEDKLKFPINPALEPAAAERRVPPCYVRRGGYINYK
jgi:hypothetical protein